MTPQAAATVLVADALERGLPVNEGLSALNVSPRVVMAAKSGNVPEVLNGLSVDPVLQRVAAAWPRAFAPALRRFEALPNQATFTFHVMQTAGYVFFLALLQTLVGAMVMFKVHPLVEQMGADFGLPTMVHVATTISTLVLFAVIPFVAWLVSGATGWARLPGWGREMKRAKEAVVAAALLESHPPDDVRLAFYSKLEWLGDATLSPVDLSLLAERTTADAERALARYLAALRFVALGLLSLNAFGLLASVYVSLSRLAGVGS